MTTQPLDERISQALFVATRFERALHDHGPWTMTWGPHSVPATRTVHEDGVSFSAEFPETCWIDPPQPCIALRCAGEIVGIKAIDHPGDAAFAITWELAQLAQV